MLTWQIRRGQFDDLSLATLVAGFSDRDEALDYLRNQDYTHYQYTLEYKEEA